MSSDTGTAPHHKPVQRSVARAVEQEEPRGDTSELFAGAGLTCAQRLRLLAFRSRAAACLRGAAAFFAEPLRGDAVEVRLAAALTTAFGLAGERFFSACRFSTFAAAALGATAFRDAGRAFGEASVAAITFSGVFDGVAFVGLKTSLLVLTATLCVVTADAAGAAEAALVLPFGRPPFLAN